MTREEERTRLGSAPASISAPASPREVFQLVSRVGQLGGIEAVLDHVDWAGASPEMIRSAFLLDAGKVAAETTPPLDVRASALTILTSPEFQANVINFALAAFPSKTRLLFVHIPKCGGTTINALLSHQFASLDDHVSKAEWTRQSQLFRVMGEFYKKTLDRDFIFVSQHKSLRWFLTSGMRRPGDKIFTVVRDPHQIVLSQINYIIKRFREDPGCIAPDTASWGRSIGLSRFDPDLDSEQLRGLAFKLFDNKEAVNFKLLTTYLGDGTALSAIDLIQKSNIEIITLSQVHQWLKDRWGISSNFIGNKSENNIDMTDLDPTRRSFLVGACAEDQLIYDFIVSRNAPWDRVGREQKIPADALTPQAMITGLYRSILRRDPDPQGMKSYIDAIAAGATMQSIISRMIGSLEFRQKFAAREGTAHQID